MASELKHCPFCSKTMMLRSALWPSEGDADAIIHADPTDCPMLGFSDGSADGSIIEKWNCSLSNEDDFPSDGSCVRCGSVPRNANGLCNTCLDEDAERLENTRPTPVAPVSPDATGKCGELVTVSPKDYDFYEDGELVTRSQAAELLAAKDAENASLKAGIKRLSDEQELLAETGESDMISVVKLAARLSEAEAEAERWHKKAMDAGVISHSDGTTSHPMRKERDDLKADNAALTARVKGLEQVNAKLCDDVIDYELKIAERDTSIKALEAKLAAAEPLLTIWDELPDNTSSAGLMAAWFIKAGTIVREARAALGGKPS